MVAEGCVHSSMNSARIMPNMFHNVNLTTLGPGFTNRGHHPNACPCATATWQANSCLEATILPVKFTSRCQSRRSEVSTRMLAQQRPDPKASIRNIGILGQVGVKLQLSIAPTAVPKLEGPFGCIGRAWKTQADASLGPMAPLFLNQCLYTWVCLCSRTRHATPADQ